MIERLQARRIQNDIRNVLVEVWDPLGLKGIAPRDEYDSYIGTMYKLLSIGASDDQIRAELTRIETELMGMEIPEHSEHLHAECLDQTIAALRMVKLPKSSK